MKEKQSENNEGTKSLKEPEFDGVYGRYRITLSDQAEVKRYRISVLICGISFSAGLLHWLTIGPSFTWLWLLVMTISLGLALQWIHIYLRLLHNALKLFWALGVLGIIIIMLNVGTEFILPSIAKEPKWTLLIGPLFASLSGLGFKEFFCFQRPEAIGLTLLIPIALLGHLSGILSGEIVLLLIGISSILLIILAIRKFGMDTASDIGDKSVFNYLERNRTTKSA